MKPALNVVVLGAPGSGGVINAAPCNNDFTMPAWIFANPLGIGAGKSTLIGHLLAKLGEVDSQLLAKAEKEAGERGQFAWVS
jgi:hypothetical protein